MADVSDRRVGGCLINLYDEKNFLDARGRTDCFADFCRKIFVVLLVNRQTYKETFDVNNIFF